MKKLDVKYKPGKVNFFNNRIQKTAGVLILILLLSVGSTSAQVDPFRGVEAETLPNGLNIITLTNDGPPVVSINFFIRAGSIDEDDSIAGISHFCEHMFYRGTVSRTGAEMKAAIENIGGVFNAETSRDYTRYYVNLPSSEGLKALKIHCEALTRPEYRQEELDQERKVILQEYSLYQDNPMAIIQQNLYEMAFRHHPYQRSVIGTRETIGAICRDELENYRSRMYIPGNITIVLVGNFDRSRYVGFLRDFFRDLPGSPGGGPAHRTSLPIEEVRENIQQTKMPLTNALFAMAFRSPSFRQRDDVLAMDVLSFMLGKGESSIMSRELTRKTTIAREVTVEYLTPRDQGLVIFFGEVDPVRLEQMKESVFTILHKVRNGRFTDQEMERARNLLLRSFSYGLLTNEGKADVLGFYSMLGDYRFGMKYPDLISRVTREDVIEVANKYFSENYVLFALQPQDDKK